MYSAMSNFRQRSARQQSNLGQQYGQGESHKVDRRPTAFISKYLDQIENNNDDRIIGTWDSVKSFLILAAVLSMTSALLLLSARTSGNFDCFLVFLALTLLGG